MWERVKTSSRWIWLWPGFLALAAIGCTIVQLALTSPELTRKNLLSQDEGGKKQSGNWWTSENWFLKNPPSTKPPSHQPTAKPVPSPQVATLDAQVDSEPLRKVLGLGGTGTYQERIKNLALLKRPLTPSDQKKLDEFLAGSEKVNGLSDAVLYALKDGIMVFLSADSNTLGQSVEAFRQIYLDPGQDSVIRSYAMQYLVSVLPKISDAAQQTSIRDLVESVAADPTQVGSGAALLGLSVLVNNGSISIPQSQIGQMALKTASNTTIPELKRMHPLQVCGEMNVTEAAPVARDLAIHGDHAMVRMAALATLGEVGDSTDIPLLTTASNDPDNRIRTAASYALSTLEAKLTR